MTNAIHGFVAGSTAAYLKGRMKQEAVNPTAQKWMIPTLQADHLLLMAAETIRAANAPMRGFDLVVKAACVLPPLALAAGLINKEAIPFSEKGIERWNQVYQTGVVVASVAALALGNPMFAAASLSMMAIDAVAKGGLREVVDVVKGIGATFALIGYGAYAVSSNGAMAAANAVSAFIVGGDRFASLLRSIPQDPYEPPVPDNDSDDEDSSRGIDGRYMESPGVSFSARDLGSAFVRPSVY